MKTYVVNGLYHGTQGEAQKLAKELGTEWKSVEVPTDKPGLIAYLNQELTTAPVRENEPEQTENIPIDVPVRERELSHTEQLMAFEDAWEGMPLARQLHFASLAMERARYAIKEKS